MRGMFLPVEQDLSASISLPQRTEGHTAPLSADLEHQDREVPSTLLELNLGHPSGRLVTCSCREYANMHGLIMLTVKDLVITKCGGEKVWQQIVASAKCPADFVYNQPYDDAIVYDLVKAGCATLKLKPEELLEQVGYWFIVYIHAKTSYGQLLEMIGSDLGEALSHINKLHAHLLKVAHFPTIVSPTFKVTHRKGNSLRLQYTPGKESRVGLVPLVVGLVKGLGIEMLKLKEVNAVQLKTREKDGTDVLQVSWVDSNDPNNGGDSVTASEATVETSSAHIPLKHGLNGKAVGRLYPFHIMFDKDCNIMQAGPALQKVIPLDVGDAMSQFFSIKEPEGISFPNFKAIYSQRKTTPFTLAHAYDDETTFLLNGEMAWCKSKGMMFFACAPVLNSIEEARYLGIDISDFPLCDQAQARLMTAHAQTTLIKNEGSSSGESLSAVDVIGPHISDADKRQRAVSGSGRIFKSFFSPSPKLKKKDQPNVPDDERSRARPYTTIDASTISENGPIQLDGKSRIIKINGMANGENEESRSRRGRSSSGKSSSESSPRHSFGKNSGGLYSVSSISPGRSTAASSSTSSASSSDRLLNFFVEMLLEDSWDDFSLVRSLLSFDISSSNENSLSEAIVSFYMIKGKVQHLLTTSFLDYIRASPRDEGAVLFREESTSVRLFKAFLHYQAPHYIDYCTANLLRTVDTFDKPLEIDPRNAASSDVAKNTKQLLAIAQEFLEHVCKSASQCPPAVRRILRIINNEVGKKYSEVHLQAIASLLFLRFLSPALVAPQRNSLSRPASQRTLMLIAKLINNLMNNVQFGEKESFMVPLNAFISAENLSLVQNFIGELLSEDHIIAAAAEAGETQSHNAVPRLSSCSGLSDHFQFNEHYRIISALDEIKRALIQHTPALFAAASSKPKLQQTLQRIISVFLCQLPTEM